MPGGADVYPIVAAAVIGVILAVMAFGGLAVFIQGHFAYLDRVDSSAFNGYLRQSEFHPENVERLQYVAALVVVPTVTYLGCFALAGPLKRRPRAARYLCYGALAGALTGVALLAYADIAADGLYFTGSALYRAAGLLSVVVVAPVIPAIYLYERYGGRIKAVLGRWSGPAYWAGALAVIGPVAFMFVTDRHGIAAYLMGGHLNAVMYPVAQVHAGKAMLVDLTSQYGLYAQLLQPVFFVIGLDTFRFLLVMSAITCLAFGALAAFVYGNVRNRLIGLAGLATIVYSCYVLVRLITFDPYYQYVPIRLIFPALLILSGWLYFRTRSRALYYGNFLLAAVGLLWNMDSGIVTAGAWLAALAYDDWATGSLAGAARKLAGHLLRGAGLFAGVVAAFAAYVFLVSGAFPDFGMMIRYQSVYYGLGYYMIGMSWLHPWNLVALVYAAGIAYALAARIGGKADAGARSIFLLAILGAGIFSYYQGRSHDYNLAQVAYPAILIGVMFVDRLYSWFQTAISAGVVPGRDRAIALAGACAGIAGVALLAAATLSLALSAGPIADVIGNSTGSVLHQPDSEMTEILQFIRDNTRPGDEVYIISHDQGYYYAETGTSNPIKIPSMEEIVHQDDVQIINAYMSDESIDRCKVFADFSSGINAIEIQSLANNYRKVGQTRNGTMCLYVPKTIN